MVRVQSRVEVKMADSIGEWFNFLVLREGYLLLLHGFFLVLGILMILSLYFK